MPTLTRWFLKTAFVCLGLGLMAGVLLGFQAQLGLSELSGVFPVYVHLMVFGWITQLIFGVVYWMFPKYSLERPRGSERLGWWTYGLLNLGLLLRVIGEPIQSVQASAPVGWMLVTAAGLQFCAGLLFVINSWSRVKER